jgi:hypothetical protein
VLFLTSMPFQDYAGERVPPSAMGFVLSGVGLIRRRYEMVPYVNLPLPRFGRWGPLANFNTYFH